MNMNRDDTASYHLGTLATHGKHATPVITARGTLTLIDYVNKYARPLLLVVVLLVKCV